VFRFAPEVGILLSASRSGINNPHLATQLVVCCESHFADLITLLATVFTVWIIYYLYSNNLYHVPRRIFRFGDFTIQVAKSY